MDNAGDKYINCQLGTLVAIIRCFDDIAQVVADTRYTQQTALLLSAPENIFF